MFERIRKLLKSESVNDIRAALAELDVEKLRTDLDRARARRTELLLSGSDDQVIAAERDIETARLAFERAEVATNELGDKLAKAEAKARDDAFLAKHAAAEAAAKATLEMVRTKVVPAVKAIDAAFAQMAQADDLLQDVDREIRANVTLDNAAGRAVPVLRAQARISDADILPGWLAYQFEIRARLA